MKLLIITAVQQFKKQVQKILHESGTKAYTFFHVKGFKDEPSMTLPPNLFGHNDYLQNSVLFMAYVPRENADHLLEQVTTFNLSNEFDTQIHLTSIAIEQSI